MSDETAKPAVLDEPTTGLIPHLGLEVVERSPGRCVLKVQVQAMHMNPHGVVHGAVPYAMADSGMGAAAYTTMVEGESCATIEINMVYIAPIREGEIVCETRVVNRGKSIAVLESDIHNNGRLAARALGTYSIFQRR